MQFMATPGGLLQTIIPSTRVTQDDAICEAVGLDSVVLQVPDLEKAAGQKTVITDVVGKGDTVIVTYHENAGAKTASEVRVRAKARS